MTTGNKVTGSLNLPAFFDYTNIVWSGSDYPPGRPAPPPTGLPPKFRTVKAWENGKYVETTYPILYDAFTRKGPKRQYSEDHPFQKTVTYKHDPTSVSYRTNYYQSFRPVYLLQQMAAGISSRTDVSGGWTSSNDYRLIGRLQNAVSGSTFNAGVFLGEGREALNMIANRASQIYGAFRAFKHGDSRSAARILTRHNDRKKAISRTAVANNWLELQYGWLPLLADIHDGMGFLAHHLNVPLQHVVRVSEKSSNPSQTFGQGQFIHQNKVSYRRKSIKAILKEQNVYQLAGLTDPLSVAWELMPYSFVIDWFLPIGDYLAARGTASAMSGGTFVTSDKTLIGFSGIKAGVMYDPWGPTALIPSLVSTSEKYMQFTRTVSTSISVPCPRIVPLSEAFSWKRAANAVALLSNLRKEGPDRFVPITPPIDGRSKPNIFFTKLAKDSYQGFDWNRVIGVR